MCQLDMISLHNIALGIFTIITILLYLIEFFSLWLWGVFKSPSFKSDLFKNN